MSKQTQFLYDRIASYNPDMKDSRIRMIQWLIDQTWSRTMYQEEIAELLGVASYNAVDTIIHQQLKYLHMYIAQNILLAHFNDTYLDMDRLLRTSWEQTVNMMAEHESLLSFEDGFDSPAGQSRSGTKTQIALAIFKEHFDSENPKDSGKVIRTLFESKLDMGKSGATTYFYKIKRSLP